MSVISNNILAGASGQTAGGAGGYTIERSLRFSSPDSAYLSRTPASAGNRKTWTWSGWVKRGALGSTQVIFSAFSGGGGNYFLFQFNSSDQLQIFLGPSVGELVTTAVYRDVSAWYHIALVFDTTQATPSDRARLYVNGVKTTAFSTQTYPSLDNASNYVNSTVIHYLSGSYTAPVSGYFDGLLADVHFLDGLALPPYYFGEYDANNVWQPKSFNNGGATVNDGTTWSTTSTLTNAGSTFDGNLSTTGYLTAAGTATLTTSSFTIESSLRLYNNARSDQGTYTLTINGTAINFIGVGTNSNDYRWTEFDLSAFSLPLDVTSITYTVPGSSGTSLSAVEVDGVIMIDNTTTTLGYGTNGFHLDFADNSSAAALGYDAAGSNDWTVNNLSVTAGAGNDSLRDSPTNGDTANDTGLGGQVPGNYATFNPVSQQYSTANHILQNGNLQVGDGSTDKGNYALEISTIAAPASGKWYWEMTLEGIGSAERRMIGVMAADANFGQYIPHDNSTDGLVGIWCLTGQKIINGVKSAYTSVLGPGDVVGVALDQDSAAVNFYVNGTAQGSISLPSNMTNKAVLAAVSSIYPEELIIANFGQRPFAYQNPGTNRPSADYKALCTANLPTPTIEDPSTVMDVLLYTGNGTTNTPITGLDFASAPDFVWIKARSQSYDHMLFDSIRGATKNLRSNLTDAEGTNANDLQSFDSNGFTVGYGSYVNGSGATFAAWCWDAGSSTVSNTDGSITSSVRANASAGFSIVSYTGTGSSATVGHGLGVAPQFIIVKNKDNNVYDWYVYHQNINTSNPGQYYLSLNLDIARNQTSQAWNNTAPTSSVFTVNGGGTSYGGQNHIAYCFAPVAGYSAFGSYTGNGSTDGPFVYTGFRPRWILMKNSDIVENWLLYDAARDPVNGVVQYLLPNSSGGESSTQVWLDFLSNGFKVRVSPSAINGSSNKIIYAAFAESPFAYSRAR